MSYPEYRETLYAPLRPVFSWDWLDGKEYALADVHRINPSFRQEISFATEYLGKIFNKTVSIVQQGNIELLWELGIPQEALNAVRILVSPEFVTTIGRFDFAQTSEGLKMLEFNSDTPTSVVEAFYVNDQACRFHNLINPNKDMEKDIEQAFGQIIECYQELGYETDSIFFSSLGLHEEDKGTTQYLLKQSGLNAKFIPLEDLRVEDDRLWAIIDNQSVPIDVLYRLHALELLATEKNASDDYPTGAHVLDIIARKKLAIINPPSAFVAQTKALQALIWGLYESADFFSSDEQAIIKKYMLPTYLENRFLNNMSYVTKPIYGREGGAVTIYSPTGIVISKDQAESYWEQPMVYQKFVEMEEAECNSISGLFRGKLLWGSFLVGGKASAICVRIGDSITDNLSCFLPVGY